MGFLRRFFCCLYSAAGRKLDPVFTRIYNDSAPLRTIYSLKGASKEKTMKKKKLLSVLVAAALSCSLFSAVPVVSQAADTSGVTMYRLYNPNSGEHFYTKNASEKSGLVTAGWKDEGIGWIAPEKSDTPVYRLYNENAGDHHYTMNASERDGLIGAGWKDEGTGWYSDDNKTVPLYREYNPNAVTGTHNYTTDKAEHDSLVKAGWKDEGIGWYGILNEEDKATEGKTLNIQTYSYGFKALVENHYPRYIKTGETTGKIGDVEVKFTITPTKDNAYQNNLDRLLPNNAKADANDKVDLFLIEADYALKYVDADANVAMKLSDVGITSSDLSDQYKYTQDIVTDKNGDIRASSWQACSAGLIYNRAIAKAVLGSDDPAEVQKAVSDWSKYNETAAKMKAAGYLMTATANDTFRVYSNNVSAPWVKDNKVTIDANIKKWVDDSKALVDAKETGTGDLWGDEWYAGFKAPGTVFCYFGPAWFFNYCMGNSHTSGRGDDGSIAYRGGWGLCEGPQASYWGAEYVCAANGTDNPTLVKEIIKTITTDKTFLKRVAVKDLECVNSKSVLKSLASSADGNNEILGGQNPYTIFAANAEKIDMSNTCPYDQGCNEAFQAVMTDYFNGALYSYDAAVAVFQSTIKQRYPNLTF